MQKKLNGTTVDEIVRVANEMLDHVQNRQRARLLDKITATEIPINAVYCEDGGRIPNSYRYPADTTMRGIVTVETEQHGLCANIIIERTRASQSRYGRADRYGRERVNTPFLSTEEQKQLGDRAIYYMVFEPHKMDENDVSRSIIETLIENEIENKERRAKTPMSKTDETQQLGDVLNPRQMLKRPEQNAGQEQDNNTTGTGIKPSL